MREFTINLSNVDTLQGCIDAFNRDFCAHIGGHWNGNWNAFHDYLSWPDESSFGLRLSGWNDFARSLPAHKQILLAIFADNVHVTVAYI